MRMVFSSFLCFIIIFGIPSLPLVHADINKILTEGIVPCGNPGQTTYKNSAGQEVAPTAQGSQPNPNSGSEATDCQFGDFIELANNIMEIMFYIGVLLVAFLLIKTGFKYLTAGSNPGPLKEAKESFKTIGIGFFFMVTAYVIINLILTILVKPGFFTRPPLAP